jgi:hypothetical protein
MRILRVPKAMIKILPKYNNIWRSMTFTIKKKFTKKSLKLNDFDLNLYITTNVITVLLNLI